MMSEFTEELKKNFLGFSDDALDPVAKRIIQNWPTPLTPVSVLEVLDKCIYGSLSNGFIVTALTTIYEKLCEESGMSHEDCVKLATWRNPEYP